MQEQGVGTTVKHFVANDSETERMTVDVRVGERALRELYLAPFERIVAAGGWGVMAAYNGVNGAADDRERAAADRRAQGRVGLRRRGRLGLDGGPVDGRRPRSAGSTW